MKSLSRQGIAGNIKLNGKKSRVLSCKCCDVFNFKEDYSNSLAEKEIKEYEEIKEMNHILTKLSRPGWEKTFDSEEEARDILYQHICRSCINAEGLTVDSTIEDLLCTDCGCEYSYEVDAI